MCRLPDVMTRSDALACINEKPPVSRGFDGSCRVLTALGAERGGFEPPRPVAQSNGLANRRYRPLSHLSGRGGDDPDDDPDLRVPAIARNYQTAAPVVNETMREFGRRPGGLATGDRPAGNQGLRDAPSRPQIVRAETPGGSRRRRVDS